MFEILLKTIAFAILKKIAIGAGLKTAATILNIYSLFDLFTTYNDCKEFGIKALEVGYGALSDRAIGYLVDNVRRDRFSIKRTDSGLYVAESSLIPVEIYLCPVEKYDVFRSPVENWSVEKLPVDKI